VLDSTIGKVDNLCTILNLNNMSREANQCWKPILLKIADFLKFFLQDL